MQIVIPLEGRVRTVIRSSFVAAKRLAESQYTLSGDNFQMTGVTAEQVLILPDTVGVSEGQTVTDEMKMQALSFEGFIAVSAEETLPAVLGLLLRSAVAERGMPSYAKTPGVRDLSGFAGAVPSTGGFSVTFRAACQCRPVRRRPHTECGR